MSKNALILVVFILISSLTVSQEITLGVKGGVNYFSNRDIQGYGTGYTNDVFPAEKEMGNQFGGFLEVSFGSFFIRPEIMWTSLKNRYDFPTKPAAWESKRMDIPFMFGLHVYGPLKFVAGPVFSNISEFYQEGLDDHSAPIEYDENTMNLQFGLILEYGRFGVDLRYEYGLKKVPFQEQLVDFTHGYQGYGINLAQMHEYNSGQIILSVQIGIIRVNPGERRARGFRSDWRNHKRL